MENKTKIHYYLYTFCRYFSATIIFTYGIVKIFGVQFETPLITGDTPINELDPMSLVWYFFGFSYEYSFFIGLLQIITSLLLFFRKTVRLGSLVLLILMTNIVLVDYFFEVDFDAFQNAILLFCMGLFIFLSEAKLFYKYFITESSLYKKEEMPNFVNKIHKVKFFYIVAVFIGFSSFFYIIVQEHKAERSELYGVWELEKGIASFNRIYIEDGYFDVVNDNKLNSNKSGHLKLNIKSKEITLKGYSNKYIKLVNSQKNMKLDTTKAEVIFKGNYKIENNILKINNNQSELIFKKKEKNSHRIF